MHGQPHIRFIVITSLLRLVPMTRENAPVSSVLSDLPASISATPTGRISVKFGMGTFKRKSIEEFQISLKSDKNIGDLTCRYGGALGCYVAVEVLSSNRMV
jgi:hypothetical protein